FLTCLVTPKSDQVEDWLDFTHFFRFANRPHRVWIKGQVRQRGAGLKADESAAFFPQNAGGTARHPDGKGTLNDLVIALLATGHWSPRREATSDRPKEWWAEVFVPEQVIPFATVF